MTAAHPTHAAPAAAPGPLPVAGPLAGEPLPPDTAAGLRHRLLDDRADPALLSRIEDAGLNASAPPQQRWLDGWLLRLLPAKAKRARCVNAVARGRLPLDEKLARAEAACRAAGVPLVVRITPFTEPPTLEAELAARGWGRLDDTRVMWRSGLDPAADAALPAGLRLVTTDPAHYAEQVGAWRGTPPPQRRAHAARLQVSPVPYRAWLLQDADGQALAGGQIACEDDLVGLYDVYTAPPARGRGLARALCSRLIAAAAADGACHAYLQVEHDNAAARAVYHRLGFRDGYAYHYRAPAGGDLPAGAGG